MGLFNSLEKSELSITFKFDVALKFLSVHQLVILPKFETRLDELHHSNKWLSLFMEYLKQELNEQLQIVQAFTEVEHLEFVISILTLKLIQFIEQRDTIHGQMEHVALGSKSAVQGATTCYRVDMFEQPCWLSYKLFVQCA